MIANSQTNPASEIWSWDACAPDLSTCRPFATGRIVSTNGAEAGILFRATSNFGATASSPIWHGPVSAAGPPSVNGPIRANELVTPVAGQWNGGWAGASDRFQLSACATPAGGGCTTLTHSNYPRQCPDTAVVLDPFFTGRYLRVANRRLGAGPYLSLAYAVGTPYGYEVWQAGPTISTAVVGRIGRSTRGRAASCGAPPIVEASISKEAIATVTCGLGCRISLVAQRGRRSIRLLEEVVRPKRGTVRGPVRLHVPRLLHRLGAGRVSMIVMVNGRRVAQRTVLLGSELGK